MLCAASCGVGQSTSLSPSGPACSERIECREFYRAALRQHFLPLQMTSVKFSALRFRWPLKTVRVVGPEEGEYSSVRRTGLRSMMAASHIVTGAMVCQRLHGVLQLPGVNSTRCGLGGRTPKVQAVGGGAGNQSTFLSYEEAGLIEMSKLDMHERFLCRLTVSSLNLLRIISEQEGVPIEELNAGLICDWFQKDKVKREEDMKSATLKWDSGPEW